ncbi:3-oxo-5-alpha-steroid 4-dehydrogenase 1 isoform X2 [Perca fluviatilis]|uniref:3-oxo-5-alpha-steroid 4-dehydrogenase 1 isoform X2 n=1 Tax=Perca fluviatilis TaxID=8168 RepID=UPI001965B3C8|nr:3-oxo-5-alpha-steroid 4-dehydrogenase 1 isoform X2 [Perca fluviatilis]
MDALLSRLFSSEEEELYMLDCMAYSMVFMAACTFVTLLFENVPYGRYATSKYGFPVNVRLAWFVQELPAFLVPLCLVVWTSSAKTSLLPNQLLIAMYFCHYVQRSLIYPFLIRGGKPTPFASFVLAIVFCIYNGYMQIRVLAVVGRVAGECALRPHPEEPEKARRDWLQDSHRLTGTGRSGFAVLTPQELQQLCSWMIFAGPIVTLSLLCCIKPHSALDTPQAICASAEM